VKGELPTFEFHFTEGIEHFNAGRFWEAHESWEVLWLASTSEVRQFLQGLIQLAAAYLHMGRSNHSGALRLFDSALGRLEAFPSSYYGLELEAPRIEAATARALAADSLKPAASGKQAGLQPAPPRLELRADWRSHIPRTEPW
jgi:predicted metal-dependent hydrolase